MGFEVNTFLRNIPSEARSVVWYVFIALLIAITCVLVGIYSFGKIHSARKSFVCGTLALAAFVIVISSALMIEKLTHEYILLSGVTYFIPYIFCVSYLLTKYLKLSFWEVLDFSALSYLLGRGVNIIGCTVTGCCQGIPYEYGLYSAVLGVNVIPVQLYEAIAIIVMWLVMNKLYGKSRFLYAGRCSAIGLILFGGLNAFTDIFTYIQPKLIYMISVEGIAAFLTMCTGLIMLYVLDKKHISQTNSICPSKSYDT